MHISIPDEPQALAYVKDCYYHTLESCGVPWPQLHLPWQRLCRNYQAPGRYFHTLVHVASVIQVAERLMHTIGMADELREVVVLALVYHDVVYHPKRFDNELRSAQWAKDDLASFGLKQSLIASVMRAIVATVHSQKALGFPEGRRFADTDLAAAVVSDADLSALAVPWKVFCQQGELIRQEYAHLPKAVYQAGRAAFFCELLCQPFIYHTEVARHFFEATARANMLAVLATEQNRPLEYHCSLCGAYQWAAPGAPLVCECGGGMLPLVSDLCSCADQ